MDGLDFFNTGNMQYLESAYQQYKEDPNSVDESLKYFFQGFEAAATQISVDSQSGKVTRVMPSEFLDDYGFGETGFEGKNLDDEQERVFELISAYRKYGHLQSRINPFGEPETTRFLDLNEHGLGEEDLEKVYFTGILPGDNQKTLKEIIKQCEETYCTTMSVEYVGIVQDVDEFRWLQSKVEELGVSDPLDSRQRIDIYRHLYKAATFENFLHRKYVGQKRFSLEGLDSMIPMLHAAVDELANSGTTEVMLGMAHRGRLNVLTNVLGKPHELVMGEFEGVSQTWSKGDGDVKYHMGYFNELTTSSGKIVSMYLNPNPSHLELVNPVIQGKTYSRQKVLKDSEKKMVVPILIHGDAAFAGQGINMEQLQMSQMRGYAVGGTIHIIADNQIGFTANPPESRSTRYPTDLFKMGDSPVFHANADDPESVVKCMRLAVQYRQKFKKDVAVHLLGYRRYGHNEGDEPAFTQPLLYKVIKKHPSAHKIYRDVLLKEKGIIEGEIKGIETEFNEHLEKSHQACNSMNVQCVSTNAEPGWQEVWEEDLQKRKTGVPLEVLDRLVQKMSSLPEELNSNKKITKFITGRKENWAEDKIDWAFAESLCFGSLLLENFRVRLSGQDSRRGTFSQRNLVVYDEKTGEEFIPLNHLKPDQQTICVFNSMLSELAVLGFEYGFALGNPQTLVMWEAQFGDFANGAQAMMDVFISSGESKWQSKNGLVMLLPHGYEGQGPEHSSARLERYLQLCADYNLRVCNTTTPANYFHVLRRQIMKKDRRPLVLMTPKVLLRHRRCVSSRSDFDREQVFRKVIVGTGDGKRDETATRLILCSGKLYYDLLDFKEKNDLSGFEFIRMEQLYPFPYKTLQNIASSYQNLKEVFWVQEERKNMGAWSYLESKLREVLKPFDIEPHYVGRNEGASPCTGSAKIHREEQDHLIQQAFA